MCNVIIELKLQCKMPEPNNYTLKIFVHIYMECWIQIHIYRQS